MGTLQRSPDSLPGFGEGIGTREREREREKFIKDRKGDEGETGKVGKEKGRRMTRFTILAGLRIQGSDI